VTSNGNGNGGPWWVTATKTLGIGAVIALLLVWWLTQTVQRTLEAIAADTSATKSMMNAHIDAAGRVNAELLFYMRAQCNILARAYRTDPSMCVPPRDPR
jgi:hypothetical protein